MSNRVTMPALGESVTEGTVTRWLKKVGDPIAIDEPLVEVSPAKVDPEIPSPFAGIVEGTAADPTRAGLTVRMVSKKLRDGAMDYDVDIGW